MAIQLEANAGKWTALKPESKYGRTYGDKGSAAAKVRLCDRVGCSQTGDRPAPKAPNSPERWYFCEPHAAEYNKNWDYFAGLDPAEAPTQLKGVVIYDLRDAAQPALILAQEGMILNDPASDRVGLRLLNGSQHQESGNPPRYQWITFGRYEFKLDLAAALKRAAGKSGALDIRQIKAKLAGAQTLERRELRAMGEHYKTYAFPFACLIFGMIGIPLGLAIKQSGRLGGFALGIALALIYYLFIIIADFLVTSRVTTPLAAAWLPNLIMTVVAVFLLAGSTRGRFTRWFRSGGR